MTPFTIHIGVAACLPMDNIDTDQIIPSREMKTVSKTGLGEGLFASQRYLRDRVPNPDFVLNQSEFEMATILISGKNFGCGSSREHAVWALKDYGVRVVIAQSFGEIFYNNCVRNGILPIQLSASEIESLGRDVEINLMDQTVNGISFEIASGEKRMLIEGQDGIALTLEHAAEISNWFDEDRNRRDWAYARHCETLN